MHSITKWARDVLNAECVVLDTETTGVGSQDEVIQIAVVNVAGQTVYESFVRPYKAAVTAGAYRVHGIGDDLLAGAPHLHALWTQIGAACKGSPILAYNAVFDRRLLLQTAVAGQQRGVQSAIMGMHFVDAMEKYARFQRQKKWFSLGKACEREGIELNGAHAAAADALATLNLVRRMAGMPLTTEV